MYYLVKLNKEYPTTQRMRDLESGEFKDLSFEAVRFGDVPEWAKTVDGLDIKTMVDEPKKSKTMLRASAKPSRKKKKK